MSEGFRGGKIPPDRRIIKTYEFEMIERCIKCGRKLKSPQSKQLGYGPTCYKKRLNDSGKYRGRRLF